MRKTSAHLGNRYWQVETDRGPRRFLMKDHELGSDVNLGHFGGGTFKSGKIKISVKASDVRTTVAAYRLLAARCEYPLHLGVTEAGTFLAGTVRSSVGLGILLAEGIGDTIRVSLTDTPLREVQVGLELLRSLGLRQPGPSVLS